MDIKTYKHYKGGLYNLVGLALMEDTKQKVVVYCSHEDGQVWVRPADEFFAKFDLVQSVAPEKDHK
jgi:hypothetical protein